MKCPKCGSYVPEENTFCTNCGYRVRTPQVKPQTTREQSEPIKPPRRQKQRPAGGVNWQPVVIGVLVTAVLMLGLYAILGGRSSGRSGQAPATIAQPTQQTGADTATPAPEATPTPTPAEAPAASLAHIRDVTATSVYSGKYSYLPALVRDGDLTTAWVEGVSGQGEGESITIWFDDACRLSGFSVSAGYHKTASLYEKNSRPKEIELAFSDGSSCRVTLEDRMAQQTVTLSAPVDTMSLTIKILSVYPGTTYTDTAISEIVPF